MSNGTQSTREQIAGYLKNGRNWGRWPDNPEAGAVNLITAEKRVQAAGLVRTGRVVSLSRPLPLDPAPNNPTPVHYYLKKTDFPEGDGGGGGGVVDFIGISYHGPSTTHIDALCHTWDEDGLWEGRDPDVEITTGGAAWGSVDAWSDGIVTRGVLLDVPAHRGKRYVALDEPVHGDELEAIVAAQGVQLEPGDAVAVYCGREAYEDDTGTPWSSGEARPGLHPSCLPFIRDHDVAVLLWDMTDVGPREHGAALTVHGAIFAYGVALVDSAKLGPLAAVCAEEGRHDFMLTISPLIIRGGTGSPVNPIAVF